MIVLRLFLFAHFCGVKFVSGEFYMDFEIFKIVSLCVNSCSVLSSHILSKLFAYLTERHRRLFKHD